MGRRVHCSCQIMGQCRLLPVKWKLGYAPCTATSYWYLSIPLFAHDFKGLQHLLCPRALRVQKKTSEFQITNTLSVSQAVKRCYKVHFKYHWIVTSSWYSLHALIVSCSAQLFLPLDFTLPERSVAQHSLNPSNTEVLPSCLSRFLLVGR